MNRVKTASIVSGKKKNYKGLMWLIAIIVAVSAGYFAMQPIKRNLAERYISCGDQHLNDRAYIEAIVDYKKANYLNKNSNALAKIDLANKGQVNILDLEMFFREKNNLSVLDMLNETQKVPSSQSEGLKEVKEIIENNEPQMAEVASGMILEMDENNKEAWVYLGMSRLQTARIVQMTEQNRTAKLNSAKEAFSKASELDSGYELAKKYIEEVEGLL